MEASGSCLVIAQAMKPVGPLLGLVLARAGCAEFEAQSQPDPSSLCRPRAMSDIERARQSGTDTVNAVRRDRGRRHAAYLLRTVGQPDPRQPLCAGPHDGDL